MDLRARILDAAEQLAATQSLDKLTLAEVARAAGVSRQTVYRHFGRQRDLKALLAGQGAADSGQDPDTRRRLLAAASRVFARRGYHNASLDQVAEAAGLTKGAIYRHFDSKSELFLTLLEERLQQQCQVFLGLIPAILNRKHPEEGIAALIMGQLSASEHDAQWPWLLMEFISHSRDAALHERLASFFDTLMAGTSNAIRALQEQDALARDLDPARVAMLANLLGNGFLLAQMLNPRLLDSPNLARDLARILWRGLSPGDG